MTSTMSDGQQATVSQAWWRLWAIAIIAHMLSNVARPEAIGRGVTNGIVGLLALALLYRADDAPLRVAVAAGVIVSFVVDAPFVGNHWWLAAIVCAAALIARPDRPDWWGRFAPAGRVLVLTFYTFAAFAKLNSSFFDAAASCSRYFTNRTLELWQMPEIGGGSPLATVLPYGTFAIEASVPLLLLFRPTRKFGVWLAVGFHLLIALDLRQHFFDFTLVLLPLFLLFVPDDTLVAIEARLPRFTDRRRKQLTGAVAIGLVWLALPVPLTAKGVPVLLAWVGWLYLFYVIVRAVYGAKWQPDSVRMRPQAIMVPLLLLVVLNGLSPYLELKSATGFNMYANLTTVNGESNHYLVSSTAHWRDTQDTLVVVLETEDEDLAEYIDSGFAIPQANFDSYLIDNPDTAAVVEIDGERVTITSGAARTYAPESQPMLLERFAFFRAVAIDDPAVCQPLFLPAR